MQSERIYVEFFDSISTQSNCEKKLLEEIIQSIQGNEYIEIVTKIRDSQKREKSDLKTRLPAFRPTLSSKTDLTLTGIIQFDLDSKDNVEVDFPTLKKSIISLPECIYAYTSPSNGLKFGIKTD